MAMQPVILEQIHIDVVRNATDDFNPFHDPYRWRNIRANPFGGPIALGFQLVGLALDRVSQYRTAAGEDGLAARHGLHFSNYEFSFAAAVTPGSALEVQVRKTRNKIDPEGELSNRVTVKHDGKLALMGMRKDATAPTALAGDWPELPEMLSGLADRSLLPGSGYFLKRKFLMTSNGKNYCAGCFIPQHHYFDELANRVHFPASFILSLVSCALLERAWSEGHDFEARPYVYTSQAFSFDNRVQRKLKSNDRLHLLVSPSRELAEDGGLGGSRIPQIQHTCYGILNDDELLFRGHVGLAELHEVVGTH